VIVSVNGIPQKAALGEDGTFQATVELAYGENIISAVAVASNNEIGSDRVSVILQREVLFFDDFEEGPDPAWGAASGTWVGTGDGKYTIQEREWDANAFTYVVEGTSWRDYAVEVDVIGANKYWGDEQYVGVVVRALDDRNKILLINEYRNWLCWYVYRNDRAEECVGGAVHPGLPDSAHIRIEAVGDTIAAYVNGVKRTTLKLKGEDAELFKQGMPGLYIRYNLGVVFDNFKVISLGGRGTAPAYTGELPESPTQVSAEEWQKAVSQLEKEVKPTLATLRTSLGGYELKLRELSGRVSSLESTLGEGLEPLKLRVERLDSRYRVLESKMEAHSQLITKVPPDIDLRLSSFQEGISAHDREIQALKGDLKGIGNVARLGLIAGAAGLILAGLALLGVIS